MTTTDGNGGTEPPPAPAPRAVPSGLLRWGQVGRYTAYDDRLVITALAGGRVGIVRPTHLGAGSGLNVTVEGGWLAVARAGDGTSVVIASTIAAVVPIEPGGPDPRTDIIQALVADPESAAWQLAVLPAGYGDAGGVTLGTVEVPAGAVSAGQMTLTAAPQDFATGGAIPGPAGMPGPEGPPGDQGEQGPQGTGLTMRESVPSAAQLPPAGNFPGDLRVAEDTGLAWAWFDPATVGGGGATGPPGVQGPRGEAGPPGATGATGPTGPPGPTGAPGETLPALRMVGWTPDQAWPTPAFGTAETALLQLDTPSLPAGRVWRVVVVPANFIPTAVTQLVWRLRWTTDGSVPNTSSAQLRQRVQRADSGGNNYVTPLLDYTWTGAGVRRLLVTGNVQAGTCQLSSLCVIRVEDMGPDIGQNVNVGRLIGSGSTGVA